MAWTRTVRSGCTSKTSLSPPCRFIDLRRRSGKVRPPRVMRIADFKADLGGAPPAPLVDSFPRRQLHEAGGCPPCAHGVPYAAHGQHFFQFRQGRRQQAPTSIVSHDAEVRPDRELRW